MAHPFHLYQDALKVIALMLNYLRDVPCEHLPVVFHLLVLILHGYLLIPRRAAGAGK